MYILFFISLEVQGLFREDFSTILSVEFVLLVASVILENHTFGVIF